MLRFATLSLTPHTNSTPSALAKYFFTKLGIDLAKPPGKSVFFNDRLGYLFVKATEKDLDTIERALQVLARARTGAESRL